MEGLRKVLAKNLADLSEVEWRIVAARFGLDRHLPGFSPPTLAAVGATVGLTKERARQVQNRALQKLRDALEDSTLA